MIAIPAQVLAEERLSLDGRPALSSLELARTVMALSQGFAQQPADRASVKQIMRHVLGRLFGE